MKLIHSAQFNAARCKELGADNELIVYTMHKISNLKKDLEIWRLGHERLAQLEEKNVITE